MDAERDFQQRLAREWKPKKERLAREWKPKKEGK